MPAKPFLPSVEGRQGACCFFMVYARPRALSAIAGVFWSAVVAIEGDVIAQSVVQLRTSWLETYAQHWAGSIRQLSSPLDWREY